MFAKLFNCDPKGMTTMRDSLRMLAVAGVLLLFIGLGVDHVIRPQRYMTNTFLRSGGDLRREWNEMGAQISGLILTCGAGYVLFVVIRELWARCHG